MCYLLVLYHAGMCWQLFSLAVQIAYIKVPDCNISALCCSSFQTFVQLKSNLEQKWARVPLGGLKKLELSSMKDIFLLVFETTRSWPPIYIRNEKGHEIIKSSLIDGVRTTAKEENLDSRDEQIREQDHVSCFPFRYNIPFCLKQWLSLHAWRPLPDCWVGGSVERTRENKNNVKTIENMCKDFVQRCQKWKEARLC